MIQNDYYHIAMNDYEYLNAVKHFPFYNQHCISCQQICEKLMKHIVTLGNFDEDKERLLKTHSLRTLYRGIKGTVPEINLQEESLASLTDYYFDVKYPGNDFFNATKEDFEKAYLTMQSVVNEVQRLLE